MAGATVSVFLEFEIFLLQHGLSTLRFLTIRCSEGVNVLKQKAEQSFIMEI